MQPQEIATKAGARRADALWMICRASTGHTGGALSALDILSVLYYDVMRVKPGDPGWSERDRFLLSKGHSVEGYLAILADLGFFPRAELRTFSQAGSRLIGHPSNKVPGVEVNTGALGHGLPIGVGLALAARRTKRAYRTFVVMGDGEQAEGSVWEAAMAGAHYGLDNLYAVVDRNGLQISGTTEQVMALDSLADKWRAFGWAVTELDGHDIAAMQRYFHETKPEGKPHLLLAHTVKGKGLSAAENQPAWHHKVPDEAQVREACNTLIGREEVDWL